MKNEMINSSRKTKKRIFAILAAWAAIPVNPRKPAIMAIMRKITTQCNIIKVLFKC